MFEERLILSSSCPYSCSLIAFANRLGGTLDPQFLIQCEIIDQKLKKSIDQLKSIPLTYYFPSSTYDYQEELFLDMDIPFKQKFFDSCQFQQYNSWLNDSNQWNRIYTFNDDLII